MKTPSMLRKLAQSSAARAPLRILIADGDRTLRDQHAASFREAGFEVETVGDGERALHKLAFAPFDLIVTEWHMPHLDGASLVLWLRAMRNPVPVIMLTADNPSAALPAAMYRELKALLHKPVPPGHLLALVQSTLGCEQTVPKEMPARGFRVVPT